MCQLWWSFTKSFLVFVNHFCCLSQPQYTASYFMPTDRIKSTHSSLYNYTTNAAFICAMILTQSAAFCIFQTSSMRQCVCNRSETCHSFSQLAALEEYITDKLKSRWCLKADRARNADIQVRTRLPYPHQSVMSFLFLASWPACQPLLQPTRLQKLQIDSSLNTIV